jgi:protein ImuB
VAAVLERIRWQLDGWARRLDEHTVAGVVLLRLEPTEVRADDGAQAGLWGGRSQVDEWAQRAVARLAGLVGDEQVVMAEWRGGRLPADQYRWVPASLGVGSGAGPSSSASASAAPWVGGLPAPTPALLYPDPVPVAVLDRDGRAVGVSARGVLSSEPVQVQAEPITAWAGPWPLDERWWDPRGARRLARFQLLTASGRAYLATVERQHWWLIAEYD